MLRPIARDAGHIACRWRSQFQRHCNAIQPQWSRTFSAGTHVLLYSEVRPKPKESTTLRKSASASRPIRETPTPTRGSILPVYTLTTAQKYSLAPLMKRLPKGTQIFQDACWIPRWKTDSDSVPGEIFVFFSNGSLVCWGFGEDEAQAFARKYLTSNGIEIEPLKDVESEDLEFVIDPNE